MKMNQKPASKYTHEGGKASHINPLQELKRSVMSCLLWEDTFYESGESIADRISKLVAKNKPTDVADIALKARSDYRLRHIPLLLSCEMTKNFDGKIVGDTISEVIQRADELSEILAIYWRNGRTPLSKQMKLGLAKAWPKFNSYQLAKYNRDGSVKLRDSLFLSHAKPKDKAQEALWKKLVDGTLEAPDTWEVGLSGGGDKKETFTRLLMEGKLGYMALLRNLRNMTEAGVDRQLIANALIEGASKSKALPFRFIAAARACPQMVPELDEALKLALGDMEKLEGKTHLIVDVSGSMSSPLSAKSQMSRYDAAGGLAAMLAGICEELRVFAFGSTWTEVPPYKGLALVDVIHNTNVGHATNLGQTVREIQDKYPADRIICITDEQSRDNVPNPKGKGYIINVGSYQNGVGYGSWVKIDGFSEAVIRFIQEYEAN